MLIMTQYRIQTNDIYLKGIAMEINNLIIKSEDPNMFTDEIRSIMEDHMTYLRHHESTQPIVVDPVDAYKFEFDLFALFNRYHVPYDLWWVTMRVNDYTAPTDYRGDILVFYVPSKDVISRIIQAHRSSNRIM